MAPAMDFTLAWKALVMGIVEGLTEFLPISSTGHLILTGSLLGLNDAKAKVFDVVIQTGAMLAVVYEYRTRFLSLFTELGSEPATQRFALNLLLACLPAGLMGLAFAGVIKAHLFHPIPVAIAFIAGALVILWVERRNHRRVRVESVDDMTWRDALKIGFAQSLALIPGTSRSGATIIGGMLFGLSRRAATEFSFFLAVPTLVAAGVYDLVRNRHLFQAADLGHFGIGFVASFVSAFFCVRWLLRYIAAHDFTVFAWYRIVFGIAVLTTAYAGFVDWSHH